MEEWRNVEGFDGVLEISNLGRVKSRNRIKYQSIDRGYPKVLCFFKGKNHTFRVHRLVAKAFIDNPENKPEVNHIDGNKENNAASNLEWCTRKENMRHAIDLGLFSPSSNDRNCKNITVAVNLETGNEIKMKGNKEMIANGFQPPNVNSVLHGRLKSHKGHSFYRIEIDKEKK